MEHKLLSLESVELKFDDTGTFEGYASVYGGVDSFGDTVLPGAFDDTLKSRQRPVRMFYNHDPKWPIGKWLDIGPDGKGLKVQGQLTPGHSLANDVRAAMAHGTLDGLSIGYRIPPGGSAKEGKIRQLKRIDLVEVSVVTAPADLAARVESIKAAMESIKSVREYEEFLRDAGNFSHSEAKSLISLARNLLRDEAPRDLTSDIVNAIRTAGGTFK